MAQMSPAMKITEYLSPNGQPLEQAERFRLLEVAIRACDPLTAATPGSALYWTLVETLRQLGYEAEVVAEQGGFLLQPYLYTHERPLTSALRLLPGGATLYTIGGPAAVLPLCVAAVDGALPPNEEASQGQFALAIREMGSLPAEIEREKIERELTLVGFISMALAV